VQAGPNGAGRRSTAAGCGGRNRAERPLVAAAELVLGRNGGLAEPVNRPPPPPPPADGLRRGLVARCDFILRPSSELGCDR